jgi:hypothetical protein
MLLLIPFSTPLEPSRYRPGLRNSGGPHQLRAQQLQMILESLRQKTGFLEMGFDQSNFLTLGNRTRVASGSVAARELLIATVDGGKVVELENHNHSPHIAFAHIPKGIIQQNALTNTKIAVQPVQLDFSDFAQLQGNSEALAAFDIGFAVLHELSHVVLNLKDAVGDTTRLGACDEHINRIRRELGLPERQHYNPRLQLMGVLGGQKSIIRAELLFEHRGDGPRRIKPRRFYLRWDAESVSVVNIRSLHRDRQTRIPAVQ